MNPAWIVAVIAAGTLLAQAIGFVYLTRNHIKHLQDALNTLVAEARETNTRLSRLEGRVWRD